MRIPALIVLLLFALVPPLPTAAQERITWTDVVNATVEADGDLLKTSSCQGCPDSGARSQEQITSGDGSFEFTLQDNSIERDIGFTTETALVTAADDIKLAWRIQAGIAEVRELGAYRADTMTVVGDVLKIVVDGGGIYYYKNNELIHASSVAPTYPLFVHVLLLGVNATLTTAMFDTPDMLAAAPTATVGNGAVPPPTTGQPFSYNDYSPDAAGFVAKGKTFVDPKHRSTIRRLTNERPAQSESDIYGKAGFWNSNGTRMYHRKGGTNPQEMIIDTTTGAVVVSGSVGNFPGGTFPGDGSFAPNNADKWYYFDGTRLMSYSLAERTSTVEGEFPAALGKLGGSIDWVSRSGQFMVLHVGTKLRVWDNNDKKLYDGEVQMFSAGGWAGITPDGKYLVRTRSVLQPKVNPDDPDEEPVYRDYKYSHAINHSGNGSVDVPGVMFWSLCGGHGAFATTTANKTYFVTHDCHDTPAVYRVDVTLPQTHSDTDIAPRNKQRNDNAKLLDLAWADDGHMAAAAKGVFRNWAYVSIESDDDLFDIYGTWTRPYKSEIVMVQLEPPFEVRRLAHHRSRSVNEPDNYYYQPRVSASWDGTRIAWASNFNYQNPTTTIKYADIYSIRHKLTPAFTTPTAGETVSGTEQVTMTVKGSMATSWTWTFFVDGVQVETGTQSRSVTTATYSWATTSVDDGQRVLKLRITDSDGLAASTTRTVTVAN